MNSASDSKQNSFETAPMTYDEIVEIMMAHSQDTIYFKDKNSRFFFNSRAHALEHGLDDPRQMIGKSDADFFPLEFAEKTHRGELEIMQTRQPIIGQIEQWQKTDGKVVWISASKYPLINKADEVVGVWGTSRIVTRMVEAEQELARLNQELEATNIRLRALSTVDELSGLFNQRHFHETIQKTVDYFTRRLQSHTENAFCLILLDIDKFKQVNDTFGHLVGDAAICHVATLIAANTRSSDTSFRYGGDEFALILPATAIDNGKLQAERLRQAVEATPFQSAGALIQLTISLGVACFKGELSPRQLIEEADARLYVAKQKGRNRVC